MQLPGDEINTEYIFKVSEILHSKINNFGKIRLSTAAIVDRTDELSVARLY